MDNKKSNNKKKVNLIGLFLFSIGVLAILNTALLLNEPSGILWMCYLCLLIMGIGILKRDTMIIMSQIYLLAIPVFIWNLDFLYQLIFNTPLWGITNYFFVEKTTFTIGKFISLQHFYAVPLAIYAVYLIGRERTDSWKVSLIQVTVLYAVIRFFTNPGENINCVFEPCTSFNLPFSYGVSWFLMYTLMIALTALIINNFSFLRPRNQKNYK